MEQPFKKILKDLVRTDTLKLRGKNFSGEIILGEYIQCFILGEINFFNCNFEDVYFTKSNFIVLVFTNSLNCFNDICILEIFFLNLLY